MPSTLFANVRILEGNATPPYAGALRVQGNRIVEVLRSPADASAGDAEVIDGGGATLMPGLVEAHGHLSFLDVARIEELAATPPERHTLATMANARLLLDQGFTSVCSAAAAKPRLDVAIRDAIAEGKIPGPRLLAASPELTTSGGLGDLGQPAGFRETFAIVCDGADDFRRQARISCREGVDILKLNPSGDELVPHARAARTLMSEAEMAAVCEVAQERGKRVAAHARSAEAVKRCLRQGIDIVYHATLIDEEAGDLLEAARDRVFVAPTLGISYATLHEAAPWGITAEIATQMGVRLELETAIRNMRALKRRGVRLLPGGDYGFAWNPNGRNARDLEHFVTLLGFTPLEAIAAATGLGGQLMGRGEELGQLRPGYLADLLLVDGDPLADIALLQDAGRFLAIMQDGRFHKRPSPDLAARRAAAE